ncbi:MAG: PAS domain-containing sensor histidine kinase [Acidobacteria bacterium]|nr:MAG: PAS domain-containing sensor histidine kinase [Acidobacteriota bacterium]
MSRSNPLLWPKPPAIWGYGIAVLSVGAALVISRLPAIHLQDAPVSLFLCAVLLSAWFGGIGPGFLATALSALAFNYYFLPPIHSLGPKPDEIPRLVIFTVSALFVGSLSAAERSAIESFRRARDDLKKTVQELQNTNEALQAESDERQRAEEALRRSEGYLAEAQRLTHTGSWAWRVAGRDALHLSEEWYRIYGFDPKEGLSAWEKRLSRIHPEDRAKWQEATDRAIGEKSDYEVQFRILLRDGTVKHIHTFGHPVLDASGDLVQFVGSSMDISADKQAEEALRQAQADLARVNRVTTMGELTASLAHEVNQPIAAAVTNANTCLRWLTRERPDLEEAREAASRIVKDATRAASIISRVRLLFKKGTPQRELLDVNEAIREMIVLLRSEATRYNITLRMELAADLPRIMGDRVQLQQVLMNLIVNGIDAMKEVDAARGLAVKSHRTEEEEVLVSVSDTGVGLPPQQADQLFNAFFTTKPNGTGMGLRISRSIVESHGGRLWAEDNSPRGASFHFALPMKIEAKE